MTIETEQSKQVSDDQLLADIHNTEQEKKAFEMLTEGFNILSGLPENQGNGQALLHRLKSYNYENLATQCTKLLVKLLAIKDERGL